MQENMGNSLADASGYWSSFVKVSAIWLTPPARLINTQYAESYRGVLSTRWMTPPSGGTCASRVVHCGSL